VKSRIVAIVFVLATLGLAQAVPQSSTTTTPDQKSAHTTEKARCACCDKMTKESAGGKAMACSHDMATKDAKCDMAACQGKDGKSCMASKDAKPAACCMEGKSCCGSENGKGCCAHGDNEKTAAACCGGDKCDRHSHATKS
jgi:hypothetical protein